jgi:hypothetical protein
LREASVRGLAGGRASAGRPTLAPRSLCLQGICSWLSPHRVPVNAPGSATAPRPVPADGGGKPLGAKGSLLQQVTPEVFHGHPLCKGCQLHIPPLWQGVRGQIYRKLPTLAGCVGPIPIRECPYGDEGYTHSAGPRITKCQCAHHETLKRHAHHAPAGPRITKYRCAHHEKLCVTLTTLTAGPRITKRRCAHHQKLMRPGGCPRRCGIWVGDQQR